MSNKEAPGQGVQDTACACGECGQAEECKAVQEEQGTQMEAKLAELEKQNAELSEQLLRRAAEFDNYRKRTQREKTEAYADATARAVAEFLPTLDNFERALACESTDGEFKKGIEMILTQFCDVLRSLGVEEIKAMGEPFDPDVHNAVSRAEKPELGENIVCEVFQKGYRLGERVLRHAAVIVANP